MSDRGADLEGQARRFAQELIDTTAAVLGEASAFTVSIGTSRARPQVSVTQADAFGIPLAVDGVTLFRLQVRFRFRWNTNGQYLAVEESSFAVAIEDVGEPFFHYDYLRDPLETVPVAHLNVHAHRDEVVWAMLMARTGRGKRRAKDAAKGKITRISSLHFPLGGHRHRPTMEDVLEMLIAEFGIDHAPTARAVLAAGRRRFRSVQTSVAVHDDPEAAAAALRTLGYEVIAPTDARTARVDRLERY